MTVKTKSCVSVTIEHLLEGGKSDDVLQVGSDLWNAVAPASASSGPIAVSVGLLQTRTDNGRGDPSISLSVTCWAVPGKDVQTATIGISSNLAKQYPYILGPGSTSRRSGRRTRSLWSRSSPLQEVFVQALSSLAYSSAKSDVSAFEDWAIALVGLLWHYKLIMTEPVLQGYAQKSQTLFTLLPPPEDPPAINGHRIQSSSVPDDADIEFDDEDLEIGESFLAGSLVPQSTLYPQQENGSPMISVPLFAHELTARPLLTPNYSGLDDHTMYVRTVDLTQNWSARRRLGCLQNRHYQPLVLQGLKNFFDGKKRLVKQGDLLAVEVDLNQLQYLQASSSGDGASRQSTYPSTAEKVIYFTVTNIECDPPSTNNALNPSDVHLDSAVTRLTQTGLEHARIPHVSGILSSRGIGKFTTAMQVAQHLGMHVFETTQPAEPGKDPVIVNVIKELFQDLYGSWRLTGYPILVFGTTTEPGRVPPSLVSCFKHEVDFEAIEQHSTGGRLLVKRRGRRSWA
ncbi:hypothetical protein EDB86DRAFT_2833909, partial [Lactarius hatsudake]